MPSVFISYARKDGADEAKRLYTDLQQHGITAWRDTKNLDPYADFSGEIDAAITDATHVVVCVTPDIQRKDSFVRSEIAAALVRKKPIIPLIFEGGIPPVTIINHTWIRFQDWDTGFAELLERLKRGVELITPETRREYELAYLQTIAQKYDHWRDLYTDLAATATIEQPKVRVKKGAAARYLDMQHDIFEQIRHDDEPAVTITVEGFDELREGIRKYQRVALIGDPGAGKTTTLERLAYELASEAAENENAPLPLFVRLGAYDGSDFETFLDTHFGGLHVRDYFASGARGLSPLSPLREESDPGTGGFNPLRDMSPLPSRLFLLLDGLNETPPEHVANIKDWIQRHESIPMIVSCRKLDYTGLKLPLQRVDVAPLDVFRIYLFIGNYLEEDDRERLFWGLSGEKVNHAWHNWKKAGATFDLFWTWEGEKVPEEKPDVYHNTTSDDDTVWQETVQNWREHRKLPGLLGVVTNPFLLFVTIQNYILNGELPKNTGRLFHRFVMSLMDKRGRPAAVSRPPWIDADVQRKALSILAYQIQWQQKGTTVDKTWAQEIIQKALPQWDAGQILYLAASASIIEYGSTVRFTHQLLQEYFAAYGMEEDMRRGVPATKYWPSEQWWTPTGWEETAVLLAGMQGDATEVVAWLTPVQPALAYRCVKESGSLCSDEALQKLTHPSAGARINPLPRIDRWQQKTEKEGDTRPGVGLRPDGLPDIDWVEIPEGEFLYGSDKAVDPSAYDDETPQRKIHLPTFLIARYPVTWLQYQAFVEASDGYANPAWWEYSEFAADWRKQNPQPREAYWPYPTRPRETVTWYVAVAFCRWLDAHYRARGLSPLPAGTITLPTEQQWEKAARGTDGRLYPWGNHYIPGYANINETSDNAGPYYIGQTTTVGLYPQGASAYGVLDMSGNVWEWTLSEYDTSSSNIITNNNRVLRGGAWSLNSRYARAAYRYNNYPFIRVSNFGFRLCASPISMNH